MQPPAAKCDTGVSRHLLGMACTRAFLLLASVAPSLQTTGSRCLPLEDYFSAQCCQPPGLRAALRPWVLWPSPSTRPFRGSQSREPTPRSGSAIRSGPTRSRKLPCLWPQPSVGRSRSGPTCATHSSPSHDEAPSRLIRLPPMPVFEARLPGGGRRSPDPRTRPPLTCATPSVAERPANPLQG